MTTATKFNKYQIYGILKNYHWMLREIQRIDKELSITDFTGVAQYGVEATLPHAVGIVGRALENEIVRRNDKSVRLYKYIEEVNYINEHKGSITDEKEKVILDCLLDGVSITSIALLFKTNRKQIHKMIDNIVDKLHDK